MNIGFYDSGLGGLTVLRETLKLLPNEKYFYYADNINNPYGNKGINELIIFAKKAVEYLIEKDCKIIVIACNTISTNLKDELIKMYKDIKFIFTLPLIDKKEGNILLLATQRTCDSNYVNNLMTNYKNIKVLPCPLLASLIEKDNELDIDNYLYNILKPFKDKVDIIILGCTHYHLVKEKIRSFFKPVIIVDPSLGVAKALCEVIKDKMNKELGEINIYNTKEDDKYTKRCFEILKK